MIKTASLPGYPVRINFKKSYGSFLFDENSNQHYLDFFGMYSSLPLGYNHPYLLTKEFQQEILEASQFRVCNCRIESDQKQSFLESFVKFAVPEGFSAIHFSCTGGLAVEHACKTAMYHTEQSRELTPGTAEHLSIISFNNSFHGITSFGNFTTSKTGIPGKRLSNFPDLGWPKLNDSEDLSNFLTQGNFSNVAGVIIEPIQCTSGDIHFSIEELNSIRLLTEKYGIPLIFDEVQTGFCATGNKWFFEKLGWTPDIIVFGKKAQVCGIIVKEGFDAIFNKPECGRLCITFDGNLEDMVRCKHVMKAVDELQLLENVKERSAQFCEGLRSEPRLKNLRASGVIICFELQNKEKRDTFADRLYRIGMICNATGERSIRIRPPLSVSKDEISLGLRLIKEALNDA
jgi:L-lysine 6-transaminase